jgi:Tol biopolymer transport system component
MALTLSLERVTRRCAKCLETKRRDAQKDVLAREISPNSQKERYTRNVELRSILLVMAFCATLNLGIVLVAVPIQPVWAAFPGANGKIVFASRRDGPNLEIYDMNPDGRAQTRLTYDTNLTYSTNSDDYPTWSPDGSKIAFDRYIDGQYQIYVMNADGTGERPLTSGKSPSPFPPQRFAWHPSWSPDGSRIAFASDRDSPYTLQIYSMNAADGSGVKRLTYNTNVNDYPAWSPDGSKIAFDSNIYDNTHFEIYYMNPDGTDQHQITNILSDNSMPAWSPDGSKILFLSSRFSGSRIFVMNAMDGSDQTDLSRSPVQDRRPSWSPDGSKILFARSGWLKSQPDICVMNPGGSDLTCLTLSAPDSFDPDWQPIVGHPQSTASVTAITTTVSVSVPAVTVTSTATALNTGTTTNPLIGYLGWLVAILLAVFAVGLLVHRRLSLTARHTQAQTQAEKYLPLLAKLDKMHTNGEISEAYYLKLKREYEEKLGS